MAAHPRLRATRLVKDDAKFIPARIAAYASGKPAAAVAQVATGGRPPRGR